MSELHPVRSVVIEGVPARAVISHRPLRPDDELTSVSEAEDIDRWRQNPADSNHCPLCNEYFGPVAFAAHAQACINARAPRWEAQRDTDPGLQSVNSGVKRFRPRIFGAGRG